MIDLLVVGGGPAGTTLAGLVKKYAPSRRVVLLEKSPGPRHHIGESLLPGLVPVLKELGVFEKIDAAGFPKKVGANYVWGADRGVWENDFNEVNLDELVRRHGGIPPRIEYAWQVRRSEYDEILLRHAESLGVEVRRGAVAESILEEDGRVAGARLVGGEALRARLTADCSGQSGFLSRFRKVREHHPLLKNIAAYSYFRGALWKYVYSGHPDKTKIFICSVPSGWFWYIPIAADVVSVGLVTRHDRLKSEGIKDVKELYRKELEACEEIRPLLEKASVIEDFDGTGQSFFTHQDWSYLTVAASGPGWLAAGDAAVFVDPILSTGVTLAHVCAHRAAYTVLTSWESEEPLLWSDYNRFCREAAAQYLALALFWYGNDRRAERWWLEAAGIMRSSLPVSLTDKAAFVTVSAGLTQYYDRLFSTAGLLEDTTNRPEDYPFYVAQFGAPEAARGGPLKLRFPWREELTVLPELGAGRLKPVKRVRFLKQDPDDPVRDAFNPRRIVVRHHVTLLQAVDGRRTLEEACAEAAARGVPDWWLARFGRPFLDELRVQGALEA